MDYRSIEPIKKCLKAILRFVDKNEYPEAEKIIKLMLENLYLVAKIDELNNFTENHLKKEV